MTASHTASAPAFTPREKEILALIATGNGSKQIAHSLGISLNTVANHRKNMLGKCGAKTSAELVHIYITIISKYL